MNLKKKKKKTTKRNKIKQKKKQKVGERARERGEKIIKKITLENDQPQQACMSPFMQARSTASLLGMCMGTCQARRSSALARGEDGARTKGHGIHYIQGGAGGTPPVLIQRGTGWPNSHRGTRKRKYGEGNHK